VIRFDTRTRVIAAAGSGKTSTMVAKAAYAVDRGLVEPHRILMLAFNKKAATELGDRTAGKISGQAKPNATTFHAFGLNVIGEALGSRPSVSPGPDTRQGVQRLSGIVDQLRDSDPQFRRDWDLFRLVFGKALERFGEPDDPDIDSGPKAGYKTLQGEIVASRGELMIANWLWYHGVSYVYEQPYEHDVSDPHHRQYQPDFYYPDLGVYHEHWGLDRNGQPAPHMIGYLDSVAWRRQTHRTYGTTLLETTWATIMDGTGFDYLTDQLTRLGAALDENPYREPVGEEPLDDAGMLALVGTFMVHAKSNRLDLATVMAPGLRDQLFLRLVGPILHAWDAQLQAERLVDFEDMLNQAADLIRTGQWVSPYRLVMVDEMQDTSVARARLVQALVGQDPHHRLFAVGDDWQSINRFAGADMSIMAGFEDWFGPADTCLLGRTFRSNQTISDVATQFVTANPAQLRKHVTSYRLGEPGAVRALTVPWGRTGAAVTEHLKRLDEGADSPVSVLLLGRYNHDADQLSASLQRRWRHLQVRYQTVHASKGAEADHVVVVANASKFGFPSRQQDDPILRLAMPAPEDFQYAEERRLFYVALTRARESVLIVTLDGRESPFVLELVKAGKVELRKTTGGPITLCPACGRGTVTPRTSRYGPFLGCSRYPRCSWKQSRH
jgi:DNA helicase IV